MVGSSQECTDAALAHPDIEAAAPDDLGATVAPTLPAPTRTTVRSDSQASAYARGRTGTDLRKGSL
jgi:hypothetical protein